MTPAHTGVTFDTMSDANTPQMPHGYDLVKRDRVTSTNESLRALADEGAPEGTMLVARSQSAGRGRYGRRWQSPEGNLYLSVLLRPDCAPMQALQLGFVAGVALGDAISARVPASVPVQHKWPNDILLDGKKLAGILLESGTTGGAKLDWLVIGMGVNVVSAPKDTAFPATALADHGCTLGPGDLIAPIAHALSHWIERWRKDGFAPVRAAWYARAYRRGQAVQVRFENGAKSGLFVGLDDDGAMLLQTAGGARERLSYGAVFPDIGAAG